MPAAAQPLLSCFLLVEEMVGSGPRAIFLSRRVRVDVGIGVVMCGSFDSFFVPPDLMVASPLLVLAHATHRQRKLGDLYCLFVICLLSEWREPSQCRPSAHTSGPTYLSPLPWYGLYSHICLPWLRILACCISSECGGLAPSSSTVAHLLASFSTIYSADLRILGLECASVIAHRHTASAML